MEAYLILLAFPQLALFWPFPATALVAVLATYLSIPALLFLRR